MDKDTSEGGIGMTRGKVLDALHAIYTENMWVDTLTYEKAVEKILHEDIDGDKLFESFHSAADGLRKRFERPLKRGLDWAPYYACLKHVFLAASQDEIVIAPRYSCQRLTGCFRVEIASLYNYCFAIGDNYEPFTAVVSANNNQIAIPYFFEAEDQYLVKVFIRLADNSEILLLSTSVYAVDQDLYSLNYYKADFHMHTTYSDGIEEPQITAADARRSGMDIIAITDHNQIRGSMKARKLMKEAGANMTVILGEEYSLEYSPMHILSYGLDEEVDRRYLMRWIENSDEIKKYANDDVRCDPVAYACTQVLLEKVHELGGISILAHPYWKPPITTGGRIDTPEQLFLDLSKRRQFDGVELVSGSPYGNCSTSALQHLLVREMLGSVDGIPVIGITDSHTHSIDPISGKHFTVVFARTRNEADVLDALRAGRCVAVEQNDKDSVVYGTLRYSKFAYFLLSNYFPARDRIAEREGLQLLESYMNPDVLDSLAH